VLCSWVGGSGGDRFGGLGFGLIAGLGFGAYTIVIHQTSEASELLPLIAARGATMATVLIASLTGVWRVVGHGSVPWRIVAANGLLDVSGNVTLILALRAGSLALVAVAASLYPAVTVILARLVNHEHLRAHQVAGLGVTLVALSAIALG
jgi:drug/metabolite transporter (DMT)-like permease